MKKTTKPIRLSKHAIAQLEFRGGTKQEVISAIQTIEWVPAELGRLECRKDFTFGKLWNKKLYRTKQVRPIFVEEEIEIVVVTVYVYYL